MSDEPETCAQTDSGEPETRVPAEATPPETCQFLRPETTAHRAVVSGLHPADTYAVERAWWCRHPFHGIELKIGLDIDEAVVQCRGCSLPDHGAGPQA